VIPLPATRRAQALAALSAAAIACASGCIPKGEISLTSRNPGDRIRAAVRAAQSNNTKAIPGLIEMLDSDDPAARLVAIEALARITGQRLGYDWAAPEYERMEATDRWVDWYDLQQIDETIEEQTPPPDPDLQANAKDAAE